jgi:hypothetical protein
MNDGIVLQLPSRSNQWYLLSLSLAMLGLSFLFDWFHSKTRQTLLKRSVSVLHSQRIMAALESSQNLF